MSLPQSENDGVRKRHFIDAGTGRESYVRKVIDIQTGEISLVTKEAVHTTFDMKTHTETKKPVPYTKEEMQSMQHEHLQRRKQYGAIVAAQHFIKKSDDAYVLAQRFVEGTDIFTFTPETLPEESEKQLRELISKLKDSYLLYNKGQLHDNLPLDLQGENNLLVCADHTMRFIDSGSYGYQQIGKVWEGCVFDQVVARIMILENIAGRTMGDLWDDPFYATFKRYCDMYRPADETWHEQLHGPDADARQALMNIGKITHSTMVAWVNDQTMDVWLSSAQEKALYEHYLKNAYPCTVQAARLGICSTVVHF